MNENGASEGAARSADGSDATASMLDARRSNPLAVASRTDLRDAGYPRRFVDAIFGSAPLIKVPGYSRPMIRIQDLEAFLAEHTYTDGEVCP